MRELNFKETDIGKIPHDWELNKLTDYFEFKANNTLSRDALSYYGTIQNVHYGDILVKFGSHLDVQKEILPYISDEKFKSSSFIEDGDVIIADTAEDETVGKATEVLNVGNKRIVSGLHTMWLRPLDKKKYCLGYLGYAFNASVYHNQLLSLMQGTKVTSVSKSAIKETAILLPPVIEQENIASVLSNIDALIFELEKLIDKKQVIKKGAIQQLLTGKKRLQGFSSSGFQRTVIGDIPTDWTVKRVCDVSQNFTGLTYHPNDVSDYGTLVLRSSNIQNGMLSFKDNVFVCMDIPQRAKAQNGDILVCVRNGSSDLIGKSALITPEAEGMAFGAFMTVLRANEVDNKYLFYVWNYPQTQKQIHETFGATINQITAKDFRRILIPIPQYWQEQQAIGNALSTMDEEIVNLEAKKNKYIAIKQGMMQQLLTGKIRLI